MLLQAEKMHKTTTISLKIVRSVNFSQLEISHVINGPTAKNQHRCRGHLYAQNIHYVTRDSNGETIHSGIKYQSVLKDQTREITMFTQNANSSDYCDGEKRCLLHALVNISHPFSGKFFKNILKQNKTSLHIDLKS